jgi:hypothetical protein
MVYESKVSKSLTGIRIEPSALAPPLFVVFAFLGQIAALLNQLIEKIDNLFHFSYLCLQDASERQALGDRERRDLPMGPPRCVDRELSL